MMTPLHKSRHDLVAVLKHFEEELYLNWQDADKVGDYAIRAHVQDLIEAVTFVRMSAEIPIKVD